MSKSHIDRYENIDAAPVQREPRGGSLQLTVLRFPQDGGRLDGGIDW